NAFGKADRFLLRLRRTLGHGRSGRAGRRVENCVPHRRRHRRLEESERTARIARFAIAPKRAARATCSVQVKRRSLYIRYPKRIATMRGVFMNIVAAAPIISRLNPWVHAMAHYKVPHRRAFLATGGSFLVGVALQPAQLRAQSNAKAPIATIGAGHIGGTIGGLWVKNGHKVFFSSRHPEELKDLIASLG